MKALVYHGPGLRSWDTVNDPAIIDPSDVVVRIDTSTICGSDLHILRGDVPEFAEAANTNALKVVLQGSERDPSSNGHVAAGLVVGAA